jgi:hypothetical protein
MYLMRAAQHVGACGEIMNGGRQGDAPIKNGRVQRGAHRALEAVLVVLEHVIHMRRVEVLERLVLCLPP